MYRKSYYIYYSIYRFMYLCILGVKFIAHVVVVVDAASSVSRGPDSNPSAESAGSHEQQGHLSDCLYGFSYISCNMKSCNKY